MTYWLVAARWSGGAVARGQLRRDRSGAGRRHHHPGGPRGACTAAGPGARAGTLHARRTPAQRTLHCTTHHDTPPRLFASVLLLLTRHLCDVDFKIGPAIFTTELCTIFQRKAKLGEVLKSML